MIGYNIKFRSFAVFIVTYLILQSGRKCVLDIAIYRDREEPNSSPLQHNAASASGGLRDSADPR